MGWSRCVGGKTPAIGNMRLPYPRYKEIGSGETPRVKERSGGYWQAA